MQRIDYFKLFILIGVSISSATHCMEKKSNKRKFSFDTVAQKQLEDVLLHGGRLPKIIALEEETNNKESSSPSDAFCTAIKKIIDHKSHSYDIKRGKDDIESLLSQIPLAAINQTIETTYGNKTPLQILAHSLQNFIQNHPENVKKREVIKSLVYTLLEHGADPYLRDPNDLNDHNFLGIIETGNNEWIKQYKDEMLSMYRTSLETTAQIDARNDDFDKLVAKSNLDALLKKVLDINDYVKLASQPNNEMQ